MMLISARMAALLRSNYASCDRVCAPRHAAPIIVYMRGRLVSRIRLWLTRRGDAKRVYTPN